jgi:UDP-2,3-diacylglucosamine pyrophosphatase LpxH
MLLFASDLHLTDTAKRSSFSAAAFERALEEVLRSATDDGIGDIRLVLLGDVFEILKSTEWLRANVRPWEKCTEAHRQTVTRIVQSIFEQNADFFAALQKLRTDYPPLKVTYLPGNHDAPLNTEMGNGCRARLRTLLGEPGHDDRFFDPLIEDEEHGVLARHGHHWDPANRYLYGTTAIGDFIVIDVLTRLPFALAEHLGTDADDPELEFAHELDDVIPQTPNMMARWLAGGIDDLTRLRGARSMRSALAEVAEELEARMRGWRFESTLGSWWVKALKRAVPHLVGRVDMLALMRWLTSAKAPPPPQLAEEAKEEFRRSKVKAGYVIFGHTHVPEYRTIATDSIYRYLNCGTWRRVHRPADAWTRKTRPFVSSNLGALAIIRSAEEAASMNRPRHELRYSFYA